MTTPAQWLQGARPRTIPNAVSPVVVGVGAGLYVGGVSWWKAVLALVVAVSLIIGVNFANDYSDGIRGTDTDRVGPMRLVGSGAATPGVVKWAAIGCFGIAAVCGLALALTTAWWLILIGAACIAAAWFYTGGPRPYGYLGFGEVAAFVFFGLVAVLSTEFVTADTVDWVGGVCAVALGCFSSAVLVTNNLRDIPTDTEAGKITLPVRLGDARTRLLYAVLLAAPLICSLILLGATWWALLGLIAAPLVWIAYRPVRAGAIGPDLIPPLGATGRAMLTWAVLTALALGVAS